jgi:hypothetical protein
MKKMGLTTSCDKRLVTSRSHRVILAEFCVMFNGQTCFLTESPKSAVAFSEFCVHYGSFYLSVCTVSFVQ